MQIVVLAKGISVKGSVKAEPCPSYLQGFQLLRICYLCQTLRRLVRKFFPLDKNYLLEAAQLRSQGRLLISLVDLAKTCYQLEHNPLGLSDEFSEKIAGYRPVDLKPLRSFYELLAGVYRYKYGETQLSFLWDGSDHSEKYEQDWSETFEEWTTQLCRRSQFVQAILDLTIFLPDNQHPPLAENRMKAVLQELFEVEVYKTKGILHLRSA